MTVPVAPPASRDRRRAAKLAAGVAYTAFVVGITVLALVSPDAPDQPAASRRLRIEAGGPLQRPPIMPPEIGPRPFVVPDELVVPEVPSFSPPEAVIVPGPGTAAANCPSGRPAVAGTTVTVTDRDPDAHQYQVRIDGTLVNDASEGVNVWYASMTIHAADGRRVDHTVVTLDRSLTPGERVTFSETVSVTSAGGEPASARVEELHFGWVSSACPTD